MDVVNAIGVRRGAHLLIRLDPRSGAPQETGPVARPKPAGDSVVFSAQALAAMRADGDASPSRADLDGIAATTVDGPREAGPADRNRERAPASSAGPLADEPPASKPMPSGHGDRPTPFALSPRVGPSLRAYQANRAPV